MAAEQSHLVDLANTIQSQVSQIHRALASSGQEDPSFDTNARLTDFAAAGIDDLRTTLLDEIETLRDLLLTPVELLQDRFFTDGLSRHVLDRFDIYQKVPSNGTKSYASLSEETKLPIPVLKRILRHAMTQRILCEPEPGVSIAHTPASKLLAEDEAKRDYWGITSTIIYPSAAQCAHALHKWPAEAGTKDIYKTGFYLQYGQTVHEYLDAEPEVHKRYDSALYAHRNEGQYSISHIANGFDWGSLGSGTVVDVAGGIGTVSHELSTYFPKLNFVVQDLPETIAKASPSSTVTFQEHDMFTPNPLKDADVYFFRRVFMEWSDPKAIEIIANLKPALKPGKSRVVIADFYVPEPGDCANWQERRFRNSDMLSLALSNGGQRDKEAWERLFKKAGPGYRVKGVTGLRGSDMMIVEAIWEGE